jgi:hypothetical protein
MNTLAAILITGVVLAFWGFLLAILMAAATQLWLDLLDDLRGRRVRKRLKQEAER